MFSDMSTRDPAVCTATLAPLPLCERGFGMHLTSTERGDLIAYPNGRTVFLRELGDMTKCRVFSEHKCKVNVVKFSPNGRHAASGDVEGNLLIWEILTDRFSLRNTFPINKGIRDIAWSPDGKRVAVVGNSDGGTFAAAILVDTGSTVGSLTGHSGNVLAVDYKPTRPYRVASGGEDNTAMFFEGPPFKFVSTFKGHTNYVSCVRFAPDGNTYFTTSNDGKVFLFDGKTGEKKAELKQGKKATKHMGTIYSGSWSKDSKQILTASADKTCKLWNLEDNKCLATFKFGEDIKRPAIEDMQLSSLWHSSKTNTSIVSLSLSGALNFLNPENPEEIKSVQGVMKNIKSLVLDSANNLAYTGETSGVLTKWDLATGTGSWFKGKNQSTGVSAMRLSADGKLHVITLDDKARLHDIASLQRSDDKQQTPVPVGGSTRQLANANNDPTLFAVVLAQNKLVVFKDNKVASTTALSFEPYCVCFSHDDSLIYVGGKNKAVVSFSVDASGATVAATESKFDTRDVCEHVAVTPDGKYMCASDRKRSLNMFDLASGELLNSGNPLRHHTATIRSVAFSPNGSKMLSAGADSNVFIWYDGVVDGKRLKIEAHTQAISQASWLDENTIVTVGDELTIKTWTIPQAYIA